MARSVSGQDEPNRAVIGYASGQDDTISFPLGTTRCVPREKFPESYVINPLLTKLVPAIWLDIGLVLQIFATSWSINTKKKLANTASYLDLTLGR